MEITPRSRSRLLLRPWLWVASLTVVIFVVTFLGASWFVLGLAALHGAVVVAMMRRYRHNMTRSHGTLLAVQVLITGTLLLMAVLAFRSGDTSLVGAWQG